MSTKTEYIKREDAIKEFHEWIDNKETALTNGLWKLKERLSDIPSADVVERSLYERALSDVVELSRRKRGKWINYKGDLWTCSACGESLMCDDIECNNYCPNCGANMESEE